MTPNIDDLLPTAKEIQKQAAIEEAEKADEHVRRMAAAEAEKRALIEKLSKPSGLSEEEKVKLASTVIQRAVRNGLTEVQVYRFPNTLCTDRGRAINQQEPGWDEDAHRHSAGDLPALVRLPEAPRLSHQISDRRFSRRRSGRHRHRHRLGALMGDADKASSKMKRKEYEKELRKLQVELCHLQEWVKEKKLRVIVLFEGRDAAGKGGTIKAIAEKVSPRVFRVVALPAPSDREKTQMFLQR